MQRPETPSDLSTRIDDFSLQITSSQSPKFFVRVASDGGQKDEIQITDFLLGDDDDTRAFSALCVISDEYKRISSGSIIRFLDITPSNIEKGITVERHDRIIAIMRRYLGASGLQTANTYLDQRHGKYDTLVLVA